MEADLIIALLAALVCVSAMALFVRPGALRLIRGYWPVRPDVRRRFNNVHAMVPHERREAIISFYMQRDKCTREEAMRSALGENQRDSERW